MGITPIFDIFVYFGHASLQLWNCYTPKFDVHHVQGDPGCEDYSGALFSILGTHHSALYYM